MVESLPDSVAPQEPEYQNQLAPEPRNPPSISMVAEEFSQIFAWLTDTELGMTEYV